MKQMELVLTDTRNRSDVLARLHELIDFPDWHGRHLDAWLDMVNSHHGAVPHLRSETPEQFSIVIVDSGDVSQTAIMHVVRWVLRVNQRARKKEYPVPILLSIE